MAVYHIQRAREGEGDNETPLENQTVKKNFGNGLPDLGITGTSRQLPS